MKNIKVGIITFHRAHNFGAMLQAFALFEVLNKQYDVEIVDYYNKKIYSNYNIFRPVRKNLIKFGVDFFEDLKYKRINIVRFNKFEEFISSNTKLSDRCNSFYEVEKLCEKYDVLITGSDQVWNINIVGELSDIYTLNLGVEALKISYAASIGDNSLIDTYKKLYYDKLCKLDHISVRESETKIKLEKSLKLNVDEVLDPTLLITKEEWDNYFSKDNIVKAKYILGYVVKPDKNYINIINELSRITGLKVVHFDKKNPGYEHELFSAYSSSPKDFVNYIKNAEFVITTSFHATIFSIIYNKKFFVVPHTKTGIRVTNLLNKLDITNRTFNSCEDFKHIDYNFETDWKSVNKKLEDERKKSIAWLTESIEIREGNDNV